MQVPETEFDDLKEAINIQKAIRGKSIKTFQESSSTCFIFTSNIFAKKSFEAEGASYEGLTFLSMVKYYFEKGIGSYANWN